MAFGAAGTVGGDLWTARVSLEAPKVEMLVSKSAMLNFAWYLASLRTAEPGGPTAHVLGLAPGPSRPSQFWNRLSI